MTEKHTDLNTLSTPDWIREYPQVAHYTNYQGLFGILKDQQLWATHYRFLNDASELEHGMVYVDKIYQKAVESSPRLNEKLRRHYLNTPEKLRDFWSQLIFPNDTVPEFFSTSFCGIPIETNDSNRLGSDGLLSQWYGYGRSGGFAIVFDSLELYKSYHNFHKRCKVHREENSEDCENCKVEFSAKIMDKVAYDYQDGQLENRRLRTAMEHVAKIVVNDNSKDKIEDISPQTMEDNISGIIGTISLTKHKGFQEEKEIRFACLNRLQKREGGYANKSPYEISIESGAPRLKIDFFASAIRKIIIGPQSDQEEMKIIIEHSLKSNGYSNVKIIGSSIPFIPC